MLLFCFVVVIVHTWYLSLFFSETKCKPGKKIQENVVLLNWKAHAKIQALLKEKNFTWKSHLRPSCTKPFNYSANVQLMNRNIVTAIIDLLLHNDRISLPETWLSLPFTLRVSPLQVLTSSCLPQQILNTSPHSLRWVQEFTWIASSHQEYSQMFK